MKPVYVHVFQPSISALHKQDQGPNKCYIREGLSNETTDISKHGKQILVYNICVYKTKQ